MICVCVCMQACALTCTCVYLAKIDIIMQEKVSGGGMLECQKLPVKCSDLHNNASLRGLSGHSNIYERHQNSSIGKVTGYRLNDLGYI